MTTHTLADRCVHGYPLWGCPDLDELRAEDVWATLEAIPGFTEGLRQAEADHAAGLFVPFRHRFDRKGSDLTEGTTGLAGRWLTVTAIVAALLAAVLIVTWRKHS
jgi:hypothetical protein